MIQLATSPLLMKQWQHVDATLAFRMRGEEPHEICQGLTLVYLQRQSKRVRFVREIVKEVAGLAPYERRATELLKVGRDKRALKLCKRKVGPSVHGSRSQRTRTHSHNPLHCMPARRLLLMIQLRDAIILGAELSTALVVLPSLDSCSLLKPQPYLAIRSQ